MSQNTATTNGGVSFPSREGTGGSCESPSQGRRLDSGGVSKGPSGSVLAVHPGAPVRAANAAPDGGGGGGGGELAAVILAIAVTRDTGGVVCSVALEEVRGRA